MCGSGKSVFRVQRSFSNSCRSHRSPLPPLGLLAKGGVEDKGEVGFLLRNAIKEAETLPMKKRSLQMNASYAVKVK